jgi:rhodanese-related sulfurtransferase
VTVVDIRSPSDYARGHIQGAENIPASSIRVARLAKDAEVVLYCGDKSCGLGASTADELRKLGYENVAVLEGGLNDWLKLKFPAETGPGKSKSRPGWLSADATRERHLSGQVMILDLRPTIEYAAGHLPGARSAPFEELESVLLGLPRDKGLIVYDRQSTRSSQAAQKLLAAGYEVSELAGGLAGWLKKKYPLELK